MRVKSTWIKFKIAPTPSLCTRDQTGYVPEDWGLPIIIPIYKKDNKNNPPISLLIVISKFYAKHLSHKLQDWIETESII
ncbi:hypothetical protein L345_05691, partial [Ophiophagus hannah]